MLTCCSLAYILCFVGPGVFCCMMMMMMRHQEIARGWRMTKGISAGIASWANLFERSDFFWRFERYVQVRCGTVWYGKAVHRLAADD